MHLQHLSPKQETSICLACGECCKRYWITVLPHEAKRIAAFLGKSKKAFLQENCVLLVKLYPKTVPGKLTYPSAFLPKKVAKALKKHLPQLPQSFFVVPQVVLRREEKKTMRMEGKNKVFEARNACNFLGEDNRCGIYEARPQPCRLFPFIAVEGFRENYPFCGLYEKTSKDYSKQSSAYNKKVRKYFSDVEQKGFGAIWSSPPKEGLIYLQDTPLGKISVQELFEMMPQK